MMVNQVAKVHYCNNNYDEAQTCFEHLLELDPCRINGMDTYSNILYVKEATAELSHLAHRVVQQDKFSPEACYVVGNYYSLKGLHEKAVAYFKRALRLNRRFLGAWTLLGHEYVELKNIPAAIESYRSAIDINPKDFRAFYGLGQCMELSRMPFFALYYYRKATTLRPFDSRMWCALGGYVVA